MEKKPQIKMNPNREAILRALQNGDGEMTLAEISEVVGFEVKTGTTNAMIKADLIVVTGERTIVCPCCGRKHTVKTYGIGNVMTTAK